MAKDRNHDLSLEEHQVAGNGLLDRRLFLKKGITFGAISTLASTSSLALAKVPRFQRMVCHLNMKIALSVSQHRMTLLKVTVSHGRPYI